MDEKRLLKEGLDTSPEAVLRDRVLRLEAELAKVKTATADLVRLVSEAFFQARMFSYLHPAAVERIERLARILGPS